MKPGPKNQIAVLGAGAWGTALAQVMSRAGNETVLWGRDSATISEINSRRENRHYLPDIPLDSKLAATTNARIALTGADCILVAIPAQKLREGLVSVSTLVPPEIPIVLCAKGIEQSSGKMPSLIAAEILPSAPVAALSGPSFAVDVARGLPTAVTIAAAREELAAHLAGMLSDTGFRCYSSDDLTGVEIGGALKNVLAIAAGIVAGRGLGSSAQAALITRGFVELRRIAAVIGARPETVMGLSGLGDLILTCGSEKSRNFAYGARLGRGEPVNDMPLAEGVATAPMAARLSREHGVDAPIIAAVDQILSGKLNIGEAIAGLLNRPLKSEFT